jgi:uncharacterized repeat protein (TIGR01451 family)
MGRDMPRWGLLIALAVLAAFGLGGAATSGAAETEKCTDGSPLVCISISDDPEVVPPSANGSPKYVFYTATVTNRAPSSITHVTATASFSPGLDLVSGTSSVGSCTTAGGELTCSLGRLARNTSATVTATATAPQVEGTATASFTAAFDERVNDTGTPDPKQDTVSDDETTTVDARSGTAASFVPKGASVSLTTDATNTGVATAADPLIGSADIRSAPTSVLALVEEVAAPVSCPKRVICRGGPWLHADIPGTFDPPLAFGFRWDSSIVPSNLSAKKFAVLYTECLNGCPLQVISKRCSSASPAASELPCLTAVAKLSDGDWQATLLNNHNGHMR